MSTTSPDRQLSSGSRGCGTANLILLNNVRYLAEEVSTFTNFVKLTPEQMAQTRLVRNLAPLADVFVCEAIAAAHRSAPSLVGFAEALPAVGGRLFVDELKALTQIKESPAQPCVFVLGGSRIADAFSMMEQVLREGTAHRVLTSGLTGEVMLLAQGVNLGQPTEQFIRDKGLSPLSTGRGVCWTAYSERILYPQRLCRGLRAERAEIGLDDLPSDAVASGYR